jgi:hypothetical protein
VHIARNTVEVQTQIPAHRNLIGRTMTALPTVIAQQYSSLYDLILPMENMASFFLIIIFIFI